MEKLLEVVLCVVVGILACFGLFQFYTDIGVKFFHAPAVSFGVFYFAIFAPVLYFSRMRDEYKDWQAFALIVTKTIFIWLGYGIFVWFVKA